MNRVIKSLTATVAGVAMLVATSAQALAQDAPPPNYNQAPPPNYNQGYQPPPQGYQPPPQGYQQG